MRIPRLVISLLLLGTPVAGIAVSSAPVSADPFLYTQVAAGARGACAVTPDGTGVCWGVNQGSYLIADSRDLKIPTPTKVSLPHGEKFASISVGHAYSNCALAVSGRAYCWGEHHLGNYFIGTSTTPVLVEFPNDMRVTEVQSGATLGCATSVAGDLWCWGDVLTLGTTETEATRLPLKVTMPDGGSVTSFNVGIGNTCAVTNKGNGYCWGDNDDGEMGQGYVSREVFRLPTHISLPGGATIASFSAGLDRICALDTTGGGWCWGDNYDGSFGNDSYTDSATPQKIQVPHNETLSQLSTSWYHTCAITSTGTTWCWGSGDWGRLGTGVTLGGKTFRRPVLPADVQLLSLATGIATTCGLATNGNVWCWSGTDWGTNGSGSLDITLFPVRIAAVGTPSVSISSIGTIGAESIVVNSSFNGNGKKTTIHLQYSTQQTFSESRTTTVSGITRDGLYITASGSSEIAQLEPRTTYYIRVVGTNSFGTTSGAHVAVTTIGSEPTVSSPTSNDVTGNEARISANIHPGLLSTSVTLHVDTQSQFSNMTAYDMGTVSGNSSQSLEYSLTSLTAKSFYYVRVQATNKLGTTTSITSIVTTGGHSASALITSSSSTISSITSQITISTGDTKGNVLLQASETNDFNTVIASPASTFSSSGPDQHTVTVTELSVATSYWVRAVVTNDIGSFVSPTVQVQTAGSAPLLSTPVVTADITSARITSTINTTGLSSFATLLVSTQSDMSDATEYFMYSGDHTGIQQLSGSLSGLVQRTTYYATVTAKNSLGTTTTSITSFRLAIPIGVAINDDSATTESLNVTLSITLPESAVAVRISNSSEFAQAKVFERITSLPWTLGPSNSDSRSTVWIQFFDALGRATTYSDTITVVSGVSNITPTTETTTTAPTTATTAPATAPLVSGVFTLDSASTPRARRTVSLPSSVRKSGVSKVQTKLGKKVTTHKVQKMKNGSYTFSFVSKKGTVQMRLINKQGKPGKWQKMRVA